MTNMATRVSSTINSSFLFFSCIFQQLQKIREMDKLGKEKGRQIQKEHFFAFIALMHLPSLLYVLCISMLMRLCIFLLTVYTAYNNSTLHTLDTKHKILFTTLTLES